jgi:glycosyltransferase involved in cell wall biosynthesis
MRLLLDARKIEDYGIGVYIRHVFGGLLEQPFEDIRVIHLAGKERLEVPAEKEISAHSANYDPREQIEIPWKCRHLRGYYYFSPHYIFPLLLRQRLIVTVHDLIHFKFPAFFKPPVKVAMARFFLRQIKSRAALIFTVSRQTAADLAEMFSVPMDKIKIIYNGVADTFFQTPPFASPYPFPYILYVGNWKPHKNIITLLQAFRLISKLHPELRLVLIGISPQPVVQKEISRLNLEEKCLPLGFLPQPEVIRYLDGASLFVFPSLYEGFGLPPLEAMARGRAVISSPAGSLREVLADAALYFDPSSAEDLAAKIDLLLSDESKRHSYEEKGRQRSWLFRWPKAVAQHVHFLQALD